MNLNAAFYYDNQEQSVPVELELAEGTSGIWRTRWTNRTGAPVKAGRFVFRGFSFDVPGERLRLYREGWTAVSAAGTRRYGECDFFLNPDYMRHAVSDPASYTWEKKNCFSAENAVVLNDRETGKSMLAGFTTIFEFNNRFLVELDEKGLKRLDAILDCDGREVSPGETIYSEELVVLEGTDGYLLLEEYAARMGARMNARTSAEIPTGWCSWYYYFTKITEQDVLENLDWLKANRAEFPIRYFQLDDGYQFSPGDWLKPSANFPHGLGWSIRNMADAGMIPGVWFAPFVIGEKSDVFKEHPEYLLRKADGKTLVTTKFHGELCGILDCSREDACTFLKNLFAEIRSFGCRYVKLDFTCFECTLPDLVYSDPKATRISAYRKGMQAIRDGIGEDAFILGGTVFLAPCVGIADGARYGTDVTPKWGNGEPFDEAPRFPNILRNIICRRYMHKRLFITDPDVHIARRSDNEMTEDETMLWTTALYLIGGAMLLSDRFSTLEPDRAKLSKLLLKRTDPFRDVRPVDFFDRDIPMIWRGVFDDTDAPTLGFFNCYEEEKTVSADLKQAGFEGKTRWMDFWSRKEFECDGKQLVVTLPPHTARLFLAL